MSSISAAVCYDLSPLFYHAAAVWHNWSSLILFSGSGNALFHIKLVKLAVLGSLYTQEYSNGNPNASKKLHDFMTPVSSP